MKQKIELESQTEIKACNWVTDEYGDIPLKFTPRSSNGWPDRIFIIPHSGIIFWEAKRKNAEPSSLQRQRLKTLSDYDHYVIPYKVSLEGFKIHYAEIRTNHLSKTRNQKNSKQSKRGNSSRPRRRKNVMHVSSV